MHVGQVLATHPPSGSVCTYSMVDLNSATDAMASTTARLVQRQQQQRQQRRQREALQQQAAATSSTSSAPSPSSSTSPPAPKGAGQCARGALSCLIIHKHALVHSKGGWQRLSARLPAILCCAYTASGFEDARKERLAARLQLEGGSSGSIRRYSPMSRCADLEHTYICAVLCTQRSAGHQQYVLLPDIQPQK
jgi:hypothetical protein